MTLLLLVLDKTFFLLQNCFMTTPSDDVILVNSLQVKRKILCIILHPPCMLHKTNLTRIVLFRGKERAFLMGMALCSCVHSIGQSRRDFPKKDDAFKTLNFDHFTNMYAL